MKFVVASVFPDFLFCDFVVNGLKNILLAVCGLSPQVITEALYVLHKEGRRVDAVRVITTRSGKDVINAALLSPVDGRYYQYLREYRIDPGQIDFHAGHVYTITDENGREIDDISDEDDNELVLKKCLDITFDLTRDPETAVLFLVAGGRKTMTSCLTLAAQMYGRKQDRIYHVLVSPEFESNRDFFYPPCEPVQIELKDKNTQRYYKSTEYARISLIPMPFVSIRDQLSDRLLKTPHDPGTLMLSLVRDDRPVLEVNTTDRKLVYKGMEVDLQPAQMALYTLFVRQKKEHCKARKSSCKSCDECFLDMDGIRARQEEISEFYRRIAGSSALSLRADKGIFSLDTEGFNSHKSKIKRQIEQGFGPHIAPQLEIVSVGIRPDTRFGILLDRGRIRLVL